MMLGLAIRLIIHQPIRYLVVIAGVSVAAGLAFIQFGLYLGFKENASNIVDHTDADIWLCAKFHENFDFPRSLNPRVLEIARATRGVSDAVPMLIVFSDWNLDGMDKTVQVVGYDSAHNLGQPWQMLRGFPGDLNDPGAITVDTTAQLSLNGVDLDSAAQIGEVDAKVVGLTDGIRSFQGNPMLFTDLENARSFGHLSADAIHYVLIKAEPGADRSEMLRTLRDSGESLYFEAFTKDEMSHKAQDYWLTSTGAGAALEMSAFLGVLVGIVVAGQVLYTLTAEQLREYGTLKAIGASNCTLIGTIIWQAVIGALPAHAVAGVFILIGEAFIGGAGIHLLLDIRTYCWLVFFTIGVCVFASLFSAIKLFRLEPARVFNG